MRTLLVLIFSLRESVAGDEMEVLWKRYRKCHAFLMVATENRESLPEEPKGGSLDELRISVSECQAAVTRVLRGEGPGTTAAPPVTSPPAIVAEDGPPLPDTAPEVPAELRKLELHIDTDILVVQEVENVGVVQDLRPTRAESVQDCATECRDTILEQEAQCDGFSYFKRPGKKFGECYRYVGNSFPSINQSIHHSLGQENHKHAPRREDPKGPANTEGRNRFWDPGERERSQTARKSQ